MLENKIRDKTIKDYNDQWKLQGELNEDYWASDDILFDQFSNLFSVNEVKNKIIADIGAGTGRVVKTLLKYNPKKVYAIEPSYSGVNHISNNLKKYSNLKIVQTDGLKFKTPELCDIIFSLGVIHHIKNPIDILKNIRANLKPKGKIVIWVYGYENNEIYVFFYKLISVLTKKLPDFIVDKIASLLNYILVPYIFMCRYINLPLKN